jgi:hypothetical protein
LANDQTVTNSNLSRQPLEKLAGDEQIKDVWYDNFFQELEVISRLVE